MNDFGREFNSRHLHNNKSLNYLTLTLVSVMGFRLIGGPAEEAGNSHHLHITEFLS